MVTDCVTLPPAPVAVQPFALVSRVGESPDPDSWRQFIAPAIQRVRSIRLERERRRGRYVNSTSAAAAGGSGTPNPNTIP